MAKIYLPSISDFSESAVTGCNSSSGSIGGRRCLSSSIGGCHCLTIGCNDGLTIGCSDGLAVGCSAGQAVGCVILLADGCVILLSIAAQNYWLLLCCDRNDAPRPSPWLSLSKHIHDDHVAWLVVHDEV